MKKDSKAENVAAPGNPAPYNLQGKTVLITGAARKLGRATALAMARAGANVAFTYLRSTAEAEKLRAELARSSPKVAAFQCDVRQPESIARATAEVLEHFGTLDVLVNNAGAYETVPFEELTVEQWDNMFATNVRGPFLVSRHCLDALRAARGKIIHLGSLGGEKAWTTHAHYCCSKAGLHMLTRVMAKGLAPEIAVNCVAPGMIDPEDETRNTPFLAKVAAVTPMKRGGSSADVISAVMYFATAPHFITGQIMLVDGGLGLR